MALVIGYEQITLPDGSPGTIIRYDNGLVETVDANNEPVGSAGYAGPTPRAGIPAPLPTPPVAAPNNAPRRGRMPVAPAPQHPLARPIPGGAGSPAPAMTPETQAYDYTSGWNNLQPRLQ